MQAIESSEINEVVQIDYQKICIQKWIMKRRRDRKIRLERVSTSTKLPGTDRVTPPLVTPLVDNRASIEEALINIVGNIGEQNEQMSLRPSELKRAVHVDRANLREEINRNRQEVSRSKKSLKERMDEH